MNQPPLPDPATPATSPPGPEGGWNPPDIAGNALNAPAAAADEVPMLEVVPEQPSSSTPAASAYTPGGGYPPGGVYPPPPPGAQGYPPQPGMGPVPPGYGPPSYGQPGYGQPMWDAQRGWYYPTPEELARAESARRQVVLSHWLGWGGLATLFLGPMIAIALTRGSTPALYGVIAGCGLVMAVVGAIVGQIGRAKQNRVI